MPPDDLITIGLDEQHGQHIFSVPFQGLPLCPRSGRQLGQGELFGPQKFLQQRPVFGSISNGRTAGLQSPFLLGGVNSAMTAESSWIS